MDIDTLVDAIEPLCVQTKRMLEPIELRENDRIRIGSSDNLDKFIFEVQSLNSRANPRAWTNRLPGRSWGLGKKTFNAPATDTTALVVGRLWPKYHREFVDAETDQYFQYLLMRFLSQGHRAVKQAEYKVDGTHKKFDDVLESYQSAALDCSLDAEAYALFFEQGCGKTLTAIRRVDIESSRTIEPYRVLVVCPKAVRLNWEREIHKFTQSNSYEIHSMRGGKLDRVHSVVKFVHGRSMANWMIAGYESMTLTLEALKAVEWDLIILDEGHYIKGESAKRSKAALSLRDSGKQRMVLTGTPMANHAGDLFNLLEFLGQGLSGFNNYKHFFTFYNKIVHHDANAPILSGLQNVPMLQERLTRVSFIIEKKDALKELPPKVYDLHECEMTKEQAKVYEAVKDQLWVEIDEALATTEHRQMTMSNVLTKLLRLSQITSGFITYDQLYDENDQPLPRVIDRIDPNPKLEALIEILKAKNEFEKSIVWCKWVQDIKTISARLQQESIQTVTYYGATKEQDRIDAVDFFNDDPDCKVFVGNPAAAGIGINLLGNSSEHHACDHELYYSQGWSSTERSQSEDRAHRRGTKKTVRITDIVFPNTIDTTIANRVTAKREFARSVQDIRTVLNEVFAEKLRR